MAPNREMFVVGSMTQLAHYVFEDYQMRIDALRAQAMERKQKVVPESDIGVVCCMLHINRPYFALDSNRF